MKSSILFLSTFTILFSLTSYALPVMNLNSPGAETVTIFPDHQNKNLYYTAPTVMLVAKDENDLPQFSYLEYGHWFTTRAIVQSTMRPFFNRAQFESAKQTILKLNPQAVFTGLPFTQSKVVFEGILTPLIIKNECNHTAGLVGDEQSCSFNLNGKGRDILRKMFGQSLTLTMQFEYSIEGVLQQADGSYTNKTNTYRIAGRLGGPELSKYPELFRDSDGNIIDFSKD